jgi:hypothetical protein
MDKFKVNKIYANKPMIFVSIKGIAIFAAKFTTI